MSPRTRGAAYFFTGVAALITFGSVYAAYDLWGGVPRNLWRVMQALAVLALSGTIVGGVRWIKSWPSEARLKASLRAVAVLGTLAALVGLGLFTYYVERRAPSRRICSKAQLTESLSERKKLLREGLGPLFPVIDPDSTCTELKRELDALEESGECPFLPPTGARCLCGQDLWVSSAPACESGRTTCEWRPQGDREANALGCVTESGERRLREFEAP